MSKTRLLAAVRKLDVAEVGRLLDAEPHLGRAKDPMGRALIHLAAMGKGPRALRLVSLLLKRGADANAPLKLEDGYRLSPVWFAVAHGRNLSVAKRLLSRRAAPVGLFAAAWHQDIAMIRLLVKHGAKLEERVHGETPFFHAWRWRRFRAAAELLRLGAREDLERARAHAVKRRYPARDVRLLSAYA
jgi:hypothetical protein